MAIVLKSNKVYTGSVSGLPQVPILDNNPGAAFAFSAYRRLSDTYSGSIFKVRRTSDQAELDIGFRGALLNEAALLAFAGAGDAYISTWYDQSGNGNNAIQSTAANQAKIVESGSVLTEGGFPAAVFPSATPTLYGLAVPVSHVQTNYVAAIVSPNDPVALYSSAILGFNGTVGNFFVDIQADASLDQRVRLNIGRMSLIVATNYGVALPQLACVSALSKTSFNGIYYNGAVSVSDTTTASFTGDLACIFGAYYGGVPETCFKGSASELIYYDTDKSETRAAIEASLMATYGLT